MEETKQVMENISEHDLKSALQEVTDALRLEAIKKLAEIRAMRSDPCAVDPAEEARNKRMQELIQKSKELTGESNRLIATLKRAEDKVWPEGQVAPAADESAEEVREVDNDRVEFSSLLD